MIVMPTGLSQPSSNIERLARMLAFWHGQKVAFCHPKHGNVTVARSFMRDYGTGHPSDTDRYVNSRWREYTAAAAYVEEQIKMPTDLQGIAAQIQQDHLNARVMIEYPLDLIRVELVNDRSRVLVISRREIDDNLHRRKIAEFFAPQDEANKQQVPESAPAEPLLQFFEYKHLPVHLQSRSALFYEFAYHIVDVFPRNPERTVALRKLLEAKDSAVRSCVYKP